MRISSTAGLLIVITISVIVSYFFTMTLVLRDNGTHHMNKFYQSLLMGSWMGLIMTVLIPSSSNKNSPYMKLVLIVVFATMIALFTWLIREQIGVDQNQFMLSMIEHHQAAIDMVNRSRSKVTEPELNKIMDDIVSSQAIEIAEMHSILEKRGVTNKISNIFTS